MFDVLRECGALARILPEVDALWGVPQRADYHPEVDTGVHVMMVVDYAASQGYALPVRFAALTHDLGKATTPEDILPRHIGHEGRSVDLLRPLCERLRVPNECRDLALLVAREHGNIHRVMEMGAAALVRLFERCDALRKPARFAEALQACEADARGRLGFEQRDYPQAERLREALVAARAVDAGAVAQQLGRCAAEDQGRRASGARARGGGGAGKSSAALSFGARMPPWSWRTARTTHSSRATSDNSIDSTSVDMNGNGYSRPNRRKREVAGQPADAELPAATASKPTESPAR